MWFRHIRVAVADDPRSSGEVVRPYLRRPEHQRVGEQVTSDVVGQVQAQVAGRQHVPAAVREPGHRVRQSRGEETAFGQDRVRYWLRASGVITSWRSLPSGSITTSNGCLSVISPSTHGPEREALRRPVILQVVEGAPHAERDSRLRVGRGGRQVTLVVGEEVLDLDDQVMRRPE
jgi:hypothetical protein